MIRIKEFRALLAVFLLCLSQALIGCASKAASPLVWARAAEKDIPAENTFYRHSPTTVTWQGIDGATANTCFADCSGFLNEVLKRTYGIDDTGLAAWLGSKRPVARSYHDAIEKGNGFKQIHKITDIHAGDFVAIKFLKKSSVTGHVAIATAPPRLRKPTAPILADSKQWDLAIIDSTSVPHDPYREKTSHLTLLVDSG
ncbi:MAG: hypothetical protein ABI579_04085 [Candidatus Sumerlaeota bacterium]